MRNSAWLYHPVTLAVLAGSLLAGCGDSTTTVAPGSSSSGSSGSPPASSPSSSSPPQPSADALAQSVTVTRSGGLAGDQETYRVAADDPLADTVLPLTQERSVFEDLPATGEAPCCDFYTYSVYVDYAEGPDPRFVTWQDADVPPEVDQLVGAVTDAVRHPDDAS